MLNKHSSLSPSFLFFFTNRLPVSSAFEIPRQVVVLLVGAALSCNKPLASGERQKGLMARRDSPFSLCYSRTVFLSQRS